MKVPPRMNRGGTFVCAYPGEMGYYEEPSHGLRDLVECRWVRPGPGEPGQVLPDGCMDLIRLGDRVVVAGPDTAAFSTAGHRDDLEGLRFHPGVLPRLLGVPAAELRDSRVDLRDITTVRRDRTLDEVAASLASRAPRTETAPWSMQVLTQMTHRLAEGAGVADLASRAGYSSRTLQRHCFAVYGYGPAMVRRVLRFRRAARLLGGGLSAADIAYRTGYSDQAHLHREVRAFTGSTPGQLASGANRSTDVPSGSATVA